MLFWVQHWLYVSQYTKVSVMVPLTFCVQTNEVKEKRILYKTLLTIFDLIVYFTLIGIFVFECFNDNNSEWFLELFWNTISVILSIALCVALHKIRLYSDDFATENLKSNTLLMWAHQGSFILGTVLFLIAFILESLKEFVGDTAKARLELAQIYFSIVGYIPWFIVVVLMLKIFLKYAKP